MVFGLIMVFVEKVYCISIFMIPFQALHKLWKGFL